MPNTTSLTVQFEDTPFSRDGLLVMERSNRESDVDNEVYFRVHGADGHAISSTSGSISRTQTGIKRYTVEFLSLSGKNEVQLQYPNAREVTWEIQGKIYDMTGQQVGRPTIQYNAVNNTIVLPELTAPQGVILVTYDAPYDLWLAKFAGACPTVEPNSPPLDLTKGTPDDDVYIEGREPMLIMAWKDGVLDASLQLEPPECVYDEAGSFLGRRSTDSAQAVLKIEEDPDDPLRLKGKVGRSSLYAAGTLRVYPGDKAREINVEATVGELRPDYDTVYDRVVTETVTFSGTSTAQLSYQPKVGSGVSASIVGGDRMVDIWGRTSSVEVRTPREKITAVDWISRNTYTNPNARYLEADEIAIVNMFNNAIDVYGAVEVTYITSWFECKYEFVYDSNAGDFKEAWAVASLSSESASYALRKPTRRTNY